jgi:type VI secretion system secreted protein Hcp
VAFDAFIKLDGIPGESLDSKHKDEIAVLSFSFGVTQSGLAAGGPGGGAGAGKAQFQDFFFSANTQRSTPKLMQACASGEHVKTATLTVRKAGAGQQEYFKVTLSDVVVSSFQTGGSPQGEAGPMDSVGLNFAKIQVQYSPTTPKGTLGPPVTGGWDLKKNVKI